MQPRTVVKTFIRPKNMDIPVVEMNLDELTNFVVQSDDEPDRF